MTSVILDVGIGATVGLVFLGLAIYFVKNPEKLEKLFALFFGLFSRSFHWAELRHISNELQSEINTSINEINGEAGENVLVDKVKIKFSKNLTHDAFIENNEVIVRMDYHQNKKRNLVIATLNYVSKGAIPYARHYIGHDISKSVDMVLTKKIIKRDKDAIGYFLSEVYDNEIEEIKLLYKNLEEIDETGFFTRIFLTELKQIGIRYFPRATILKPIIEECIDFLEFLSTVANKEPGENVDLKFRGHLIGVGLALVGNIHTISIHRSLPYEKWISSYIKDSSLKRIYILAAGDKKDDIFISAVESIYKKIKKHDKIINHKSCHYLFKHRGKTRNGYCVILDKE